MYDGCFGLDRRPFNSIPQADHYFPAAGIEGARTTLARCIQRGEGAGLVIGPAGTGKTLLCLLLAEQFRRSFQVAMLASGRLSTRRALFQAILYELGRSYRGMDEGELRLAVIDYLTSGEGSSRGMVLLADEAHTLPLRLLEEIRLMSNVARSGQPLVRLVLAGSPALEERLASPKLDSFTQRLSARCYLEPLTRTETQDYIQSQINSAGGQGDFVFPEETCQSVFHATGGVPRLINQVCDHALLLAYVAGRRTIAPADAEEAWADLQQLPSPATDQAASDRPDSGVIEFGSLDDSAGDSCALPQGPEATIENDAAPGASLFRVAQIEDEDDHPAGSYEPGAQIHRIEELLAETEDDFEPAGAIAPEVELSFDEAIHPFREAFEAEELVTDRYSRPATRLWSDPSEAAEMPNQPSVAATPATQTPANIPAAPTIGVGAPASMAKPAVDEMRFETPDVAPDEPVTASESPAWDYPTTTWQSVASTFVSPLEPATAESVETGVATAVDEPPPPQPTSPHQYRQLFARLRRG
ncbi:MAG: AAA family ATPase [Thermoguttaceae bacterium]